MPRPHWPRRALPLLVAAALLAACGRPASVEDCERIVERVTVLEVERQRPGAKPEVLRAETERQQSITRDTMLKKCVGKRITNGIMRCVEQAKSADEIVGDCF